MAASLPETGVPRKTQCLSQGPAVLTEGPDCGGETTFHQKTLIEKSHKYVQSYVPCSVN